MDYAGTSDVHTQKRYPGTCNGAEFNKIQDKAYAENYNETPPCRDGRR